MIYLALKNFAENFNIPVIILDSLWALIMFAFLACFMILVVLFFQLKVFVYNI